MAAKKRHIEKLPSKPSPAADRGNELHKAAEDFIQGKSDDLPKPFLVTERRDELDRMREAFQASTLIVEGEWGFDRDWRPVDYDAPECWVRGKLDVFETFNLGAHGHGHDWKSGKRYPPKHLQQEQLYVVMSMARFEELRTMDFSFHYLDEPKAAMSKTLRHYERSAQTDRLKDAFTRRGIKMTSDEIFAPQPSRINCLWCDYKDDCEWAVK